MLQVEIVCNEHVIHPFRTMKFIWISEWLGKVIMYFCIFLSLCVGNGQDYTHFFRKHPTFIKLIHVFWSPHSQKIA